MFIVLLTSLVNACSIVNASSHTKHVSCNVNVNLMEENVTQIKSGATINVDASVKNIIYVKKIIFRILLHVVAKMINI